jgi:tetratricopeptide (TPR) repeat protein
MADFDEAIRLYPQGYRAYLGRGDLWNAMGRFNRALADYNKVTQINPKRSRPFMLQAWIRATCADAKYRDGKKAVESATHACELTGYKDAASLESLAAACAEVGRFDVAIMWQVQALRLYPNEQDREWPSMRLALYQGNKPYRDLRDGKPEPRGSGSDKSPLVKPRLPGPIFSPSLEDEPGGKDEPLDLD